MKIDISQPLPCPVCGGETAVAHVFLGEQLWCCENRLCGMHGARLSFREINRLSLLARLGEVAAFINEINEINGWWTKCGYVSWLEEKELNCINISQGILEYDAVFTALQELEAQ